MTAAGILICALLLADFIYAAAAAKPHIGSIAGMIVSAVLFCAILLRDRLYALIITLFRTQEGRVLLYVLLVTAAVCAAAAVILTSAMAIASGICMRRSTSVSKSLAKRYGKDIRSFPMAVIVLGCRVKEGGASLMLKKRIDAAYSYLLENENAVCIASGGKGEDEPVSEAECIRSELIEMGISPHRIISEDKSRNTRENIVFSLKLLNELEYERAAVIVTSEFHQLRAAIIAKKHGLKTYALSSGTFFPLLPSCIIREWFGIIHELLIKK